MPPGAPHHAPRAVPPSPSAAGADGKRKCANTSGFPSGPGNADFWHREEVLEVFYLAVKRTDTVLIKHSLKASIAA